MYLCNKLRTISMRKSLIIIFSLFFVLFSSCNKRKSEEQAKAIDTIPMLMMQIQKCSRLYTAEAQVHKIVTHDDQLKLKGSFLKTDFDIQVPGSNRKVAIPMDATIKAYIDFNGFDKQNIRRQGDKIEIILPDPKVMLTSSKIDHEGTRQFVSFVRSNYSDKELSALEQEGRKSIIKDIPHMDILETARQSAANILVPMLIDMGFQAENIKVSFRKKFTAADINSLLDRTTIEKK